LYLHEATGCLTRTFGGKIPHVPSAAIKNTCLTVYVVLLGFSYRIFESVSGCVISFFIHQKYGTEVPLNSGYLLFAGIQIGNIVQEKTNCSYFLLNCCLVLNSYLIRINTYSKIKKF